MEWWERPYLMTSIHGTFVFFIDSRLNSSGSLSLIRRYSRLKGGMHPNPRATRQAARRWSVVKMRTRTIGTNAATTKPMSIWTLVNMMNHLFLCPALSSPVLSAHATLPAGYSPLQPISTVRYTGYSPRLTQCRYREETERP